MKITICGSLLFFQEMVDAKSKLEKFSHTVSLPEQIEGTDYSNKSIEQGVRNIQKHNAIIKHYKRIINSDAILVWNKTKKGIKNYVGGNTFLEMGFAFVNNKSIYLLNPIPKGLNYEEEMRGMAPIVLNGKLDRIRD